MACLSKVLYIGDDSITLPPRAACPPHQQQSGKAYRHADNHQEGIINIDNVSRKVRDAIDEKLSRLD